MEYLKEEEIEEEKKDKKISFKNYDNNNYFRDTNSILSIGNEQYSIMKQLPSSRSTATLLKGYNRRPLSSVFA